MFPDYSFKLGIKSSSYCCRLTGGKWFTRLVSLWEQMFPVVKEMTGHVTFPLDHLNKLKCIPVRFPEILAKEPLWCVCMQIKKEMSNLHTFSVTPTAWQRTLASLTVRASPRPDELICIWAWSSEPPRVTRPSRGGKGSEVTTEWLLTGTRSRALRVHRDAISIMQMFNTVI